MADSLPASSSTPKRGFLPPRWVIRTAWRIHRGLYRLSGQRFGLQAMKPDREGFLQLTAIGRHSGEERSVMLGYIEDGPNYVTMAMNGWGEGEPAWWLNLQANPEADVELATGPVRVKARAANAEEQQRLMDRYRSFDVNIDKQVPFRATPTPMVILEPVAEDPLP